MHTIRGGLDLAGGKQLVDESLRGITSGGGEGLFVCFGGDGVGVVGEQVAQVEGEGGGLVDGDRTTGVVSKAHANVRGEGRFGTHSRLVAVESATERAALFGASTSMAPPLILSARCECESSATPPFMSTSRVLERDSVAVVRAVMVLPLWQKFGIFWRGR